MSTTDAREHALAIGSLRAADLLEEIHALLDGKEWDGDTTAGIAHLLNNAGFVIRDPDGMAEGDDEFPEPGQIRETGR